MKINTSNVQAQPASYDYQSKPSVEVSTPVAHKESVPDTVDRPAPAPAVAGKKPAADDQDPINDEMIKKSVDQANKTLGMYNKYIEREVHEVTHTVMYKLRDSRTKEVISEFPPKRIQDMIAKMWELAGLFVDEKL